MRKKVKQISAILTACMMSILMSLNVCAATIDVDGANVGETYTAYQLLEYTSSGDNYSYYIKKSFDNCDQLRKMLENCGFEFESTADGAQYYVTNADKINAATLSKALYSKVQTVSQCAISSQTVTAKSEEASFTGLSAGYYFVTSSLGSLCTLQSGRSTVQVRDKNSVPTITKTVNVWDKNDGCEYAQIGDTLTYTLTINLSQGLKNITINDKPDGIAVDENTIVVYGIEGNSLTKELTKVTDYNITTNDSAPKIQISLMDSVLSSNYEAIKVVYDATVSLDGALNGKGSNEAYVTYGNNNKTDIIEVEVKTSNLTISKEDKEGKLLKGAQFVLGRCGADGDSRPVNIRSLTETELKQADIKKDTDTVYYVVDTTSTNTTVDMTDASKAVIYGLDKTSKYYLTETKAPAGYNKLSESVPVNDWDTTNNSASVVVKNSAGSILPTTGGSGTTLIYLIGILFVGTAVAYYIMKRKKNIIK